MLGRASSVQGFLCWQKPFVLLQSRFHPISLLLPVLFKSLRLLPKLMPWNFPPTVLVYILQFQVLYWYIYLFWVDFCVWFNINIKSYSFACTYPFDTIDWKIPLSPLCTPGTFVKDQLTICMDLLLGSLVLSIAICVCVYAVPYFYNYCSL